MTHTSWKTLLSSIVFMLFRSQQKIPMMTFKNQCVNCNHHKTSSNLFILWYAHDFQMTLFWFLFKTMRRRRITGKKISRCFLLIFFCAESRYFFQLLCFLNDQEDVNFCLNEYFSFQHFGADHKLVCFD